MAGNILVLLVEDVAQERVAAAVAAHDPARVRVVAPARVDALHWLATDEAEARAEAEVRALAAEWSLLGLEHAEVEGGAGEADPVLAVEDALQAFPADAILVAGGAEADDGLEAALRRLGLPVERVGAHEPTGAGGLRRAARDLAGGRSRSTPFVVFAGVNLVLLVASLLLSALVALVAWLWLL